MKRFILSISVLSTLLLSGYYHQTAAMSTRLSVARVTAAPLAKLPTKSLPASVKSYLDQQFAGYTLVRVEKVFGNTFQAADRRSNANPGRTLQGTAVRFLVNEVPFTLFFDTAGKVAGTHAPGLRGDRPATTYVPANQLPGSIRDYLGKNYKGYTFLKAESHASHTGSVHHYNIEILTNNQRANLHFDSTGTFRDAHIFAAQPADRGVSYVSRKDLPAAIAQTLTSQYADQTYVMGEQHTGPNGTEYVVELVANNTLTHLHFDANGKALTRPERPDRGPRFSGPQAGPQHDRRRPDRDSFGPGFGPEDRRPGFQGPDRRDEGLGGRQMKPGRNGMGPGEPQGLGNRQILLDDSALPDAIKSYLKANFNGYTFLKATHDTAGAASDYAADIAVGKALYTFRFASNGDVLLAEAKN